jgi:hypothetical protein
LINWKVTPESAKNKSPENRKGGGEVVCALFESSGALELEDKHIRIHIHILILIIIIIGGSTNSILFNTG